MRLWVVATPVERDAVFGAGVAARIGPYNVLRVGDVTAVVSGVGMAAAAAATAAVLASEPFERVVCVGIGGGFDRLRPGDIAIGTSAVAADLGAQTADGFRSVNRLGLGPDSYTLDTSWTDILSTSATMGPILTVATVTGTDARAAELLARHQPVAEAMEGYGVAHAAAMYGVPCTEIRAISNAVGERHREDWDIPSALAALERVGAALRAC